VRGLGALVGPFALRPVLHRRGWLLPSLALSMGCTARATSASR
jgi:hypothetical protein